MVYDDKKRCGILLEIPHLLISPPRVALVVSLKNSSSCGILIILGRQAHDCNCEGIA